MSDNPTQSRQVRRRLARQTVRDDSEVGESSTAAAQQSAHEGSFNDTARTTLFADPAVDRLVALSMFKEAIESLESTFPISAVDRFGHSCSAHCLYDTSLGDIVGSMRDTLLGYFGPIECARAERIWDGTSPLDPSRVTAVRLRSIQDDLKAAFWLVSSSRNAQPNAPSPSSDLASHAEAFALRSVMNFENQQEVLEWFEERSARFLGAGRHMISQSSLGAGIALTVVQLIHAIFTHYNRTSAPDGSA